VVKQFDHNSGEYGLLPGLLLYCLKHGAAMTTINDYDELLTYLNRIGVVNKDKPIGWRQHDLCSIADKILFLRKREYPFNISYRRGIFDRLCFKINGVVHLIQYP
jgi:hypothetical protein